ncbi:hypothetical protein SLE2022_259630 [Rubroshorea leprosula]
MDIGFLMFVIILLLLFFSTFSCGIDIITSSTNLSDGRTLVSSDGRFELGFFSSSTFFNLSLFPLIYYCERLISIGKQ